LAFTIEDRDSIVGIDSIISRHAIGVVFEGGFDSKITVSLIPTTKILGTIKFRDLGCSESKESSKEGDHLEILRQ
jgi:hypothetical protein